jgi:hypothetical protein
MKLRAILRKNFAVICGMMLSASVFSQTVNLTGTINDGSANPINGANVSLKNRPAVATTTNATGSFTLVSGTTGIDDLTGNETISFGPNGIIYLKVNNEPVNIAIFNISGQQIGSIAGTNRLSGNFQVFASAYVPQHNDIYIVRVIAGKEMKSTKFISSHANVSKGLIEAPVKTSGNLKSLTVAVDTLIVTKSGYQTTKVGLSGYTGNLGNIAMVAVKVIPSAPTNLTATASSSTQINLSWTDNSNNETSFKIERAPGGTSTYTEIASVNAGVTTYQNTGLSASTSYIYRVRAYNSAGHSAYTNTSTATTQAPPATTPAAPTNLTATASSSTQINLSWTDNSNDETSFKIERAPGGTSTYTEIASVNAGVTTYQNTGLTASTSYIYRVRAYNSAGYSTYTNTSTATTQAPPATIPVAPNNLTATASTSTQINLSWTDNSNNETSFKIERAPGGTTTYAEIASVSAGATTYQNTGLIASTSYIYRVRAYNSAGYSAYTNTSTATTQAPPATTPAAPTSLTTTASSSTQINLSWTDNSNNETSFKIERAPGGTSTFSEIASVGANVTTYQNTGLTASTSYIYRVRALNTNGYSAYSNNAAATTQAAAQQTTLRFQNNTKYAMVSVKLNGIEQLPYKNFVPAGNYIDYTFTTASSISYSITVGLMDSYGKTTDYFVYNGTEQLIAGQVKTLTCTNPTLADLLSGFSTSKVWKGYYFDANNNYHECHYVFYNDGTYRLYDGSVLNETGRVTLVTWEDYAVIITFKIGASENIQMMYPFASFMQYNGPASWKVITYTKQ